MLIKDFSNVHVSQELRTQYMYRKLWELTAFNYLTR